MSEEYREEQNRPMVDCKARRAKRGEAGNPAGNRPVRERKSGESNTFLERFDSPFQHHRDFGKLAPGSYRMSTNVPYTK